MRITVLLLALLVFPGVANAQTVFKAPSSEIRSWLTANGYSSNITQGLYDYFRTISDLESGTLNDHINRVLGDQGYEGTVNDKLNRFFADQSGTSDRFRNEILFWSNSANNFSGQDPEQLVFAGEDVIFAGENVFYP